MELEGLLNKKDLTREEIIFLLELQDFGRTRRLFEKADDARKLFCGDEVHIHGLIEISNNCTLDCLYCGIQKGNNEIARYRMTPDDIIDTAKMISNLGIQTIELQSGLDPEFDADKISYIIYNLKRNLDVTITLSLGERTFEEYKTWKYAGADKYLLKHQVANATLYSTLHPKQNLNERIRHLEFLKSVGYQIGSGNIVGLPDQNIEDIADDILLCKNLQVEIASFSPFVPSPYTVYKDRQVGSVELTLKTIAIGRLVLNHSSLLATTALSTIDSLGREKALRVGANVVLPNFTPRQLRDKYQVFPKTKNVIDDPIDGVNQIQQILGSLGRKASSIKVNQ